MLHISWSCVCVCCCCDCRVDLVLEDSRLPSVQWVRRMAGRQVDLVVHLTTAWVARDPSLVVPATARRLYKASTWYRASVDRRTDTSLLPDRVFRWVNAWHCRALATQLSDSFFVIFWKKTYRPMQFSSVVFGIMLAVMAQVLLQNMKRRLCGLWSVISCPH